MIRQSFANRPYAPNFPADMAGNSPVDRAYSVRAFAALQGRHLVPFSLLSSAGVFALAVPAVIAVTLNRYIVSGLLSGSVK